MDDIITGRNMESILTQSPHILSLVNTRYGIAYPISGDALAAAKRS